MAHAEFATKRALLIGVNNYAEMPPLKYCRRDATELSGVLQKDLGFDPESVLEFVEDSKNLPQSARIFGALGQIKNNGRVQKDDLILFFFSGHGIIGKGGKDYLLPIETARYNIEKTAIKIEDIVSELKDTGCNNIVMFIDACREMGGEKGVMSIGENSAEALKTAGIVTFFACNPHDKSFEIEPLEHGSFTYCILEAIRQGEAGTVAALESYLRRQVPVINDKYDKPTQSPYAIFEPQQKGELPIFVAPHQEAHDLANREELERGVGRKYNAGELPIDLFNKIAEYLDKEPAPSFDSNKRTILIRNLCSGDLSVAAFRIAWAAHEAGNVADIKTTLKKKK